MLEFFKSSRSRLYHETTTTKFPQAFKTTLTTTTTPVQVGDLIHFVKNGTGALAKIPKHSQCFVTKVRLKVKFGQCVPAPSARRFVVSGDDVGFDFYSYKNDKIEDNKVRIFTSTTR